MFCCYPLLPRTVTYTCLTFLCTDVPCFQKNSHLKSERKLAKFKGHGQFNKCTEKTVNFFISDSYFDGGDSPMNFDYFIHSV